MAFDTFAPSAASRAAAGNGIFAANAGKTYSRAAAGNRIFVAGDRRPKTCRKTRPMRRDARAALTIAKNRPKIRLSAGRSSTASFGGLDGGRARARTWDPLIKFVLLRDPCETNRLAGQLKPQNSGRSSVSCCRDEPPAA
jgi:hypothetical protein